jgi:gamma-glutamyl phosphate reductase
MKSSVEELERKGKVAKAASRHMAYLPTEIKDKALHNICDDLLTKKNEILAANRS